MRVAIVYHTLSGNTRRVAELLAARLAGTADADLVEVRDRYQYSTLTAYAVGAPRALRGEPLHHFGLVNGVQCTPYGNLSHACV